MNIAVVGSRVGVTRVFVFNCLTNLLAEGWFGENAKVVSGGAQGVDTFAEEWASAVGFKKENVLVFRPKAWDKLSILKRNAEIVAAADKLVAFKGQGSKTKGTEYTYALALKKGIPSKIFYYPNSEAFD